MNVNEAPDFKAADPEDPVYAPKYDENGTGPVATFAATDPEGASVDWSLKGDGRRASFSIDANGVLTFKKSPNFEMPLDTMRDTVAEDLDADPPVIGVVVEAPIDNDYLVTVVGHREKRASPTPKARRNRPPWK